MISYDFTVPPRSIEVNVSQSLHRGRALIVSMQITEVGSKGSAHVYDGANEYGVRKASLRAIQNYCFSPYIRGGIECLTGIYVTLNDENTYLRVEYYPARESSETS
jgi:hypothetical protein